MGVDAGRWLRVRVEADHWWAGLLTKEGNTAGDLWSTRIAVDHVDTGPLLNWSHTKEDRVDGLIKQFRGDTEVLYDHEWIELVPRLATTGQFLGHKSTVK